MQKKKIWIIFILVLLLNFTNVNAACDYETQVNLATQAANVKTNVEAGWFETGEYIEAEIMGEDGDYLMEAEETRVIVSIYNITENIYLKITNKNTDVENTYYFEDTDAGKIEWTLTDLENINEYEIKVYSRHSDCQGEELRTLNLVTPKYNNYHNQYYCIGLSEYYCQEFITSDLNMTESQVYEIAMKKQEELKNKEEEQKTETQSFWDKYSLYIIGGTVIVIIGVATTAIIRIRRRSSVI